MLVRGGGGEVEVGQIVVVDVQLPAEQKAGGQIANPFSSAFFMPGFMKSESGCVACVRSFASFGKVFFRARRYQTRTRVRQRSL